MSMNGSQQEVTGSHRPWKSKLSESRLISARQEGYSLRGAEASGSFAAVAVI
jgi:hypothetical protein